MTLLARLSEPRGGSCVVFHGEQLQAQCVSILCTILRLLEAAVAAKKSGPCRRGKGSLAAWSLYDDLERINVRLRLLPLVLAALMTGMAIAQDSASLIGTIRDSSSAIIVGAAVTITNADNGLVRGFVSNSSGEYLAAALPPGRYSITVQRPELHAVDHAGSRS
jgi:hypothetical protein